MNLEVSANYPQLAYTPPIWKHIPPKVCIVLPSLFFVSKRVDYILDIRYTNSCAVQDNLKKLAIIAQLDRVSDYESEGRGFESLWSHHLKRLKMLGSS